MNRITKLVIVSSPTKTLREWIDLSFLLAEMFEMKHEEFIKIPHVHIEKSETATFLGDLNFDHIVLLGSPVAACFGIPYSELAIYERGDKSFLLLPHGEALKEWSMTNFSKAIDSIKSFLNK